MTIRRRRGAAGQQYALVVGLIAVVGLFAVASVGSSISGLFGRTGNTLQNVVNGASAGTPTSDQQQSGPGNTPASDSCKSLYQGGATTDGLYSLQPSGAASASMHYCLMSAQGGGWTLAGIIQTPNSTNWNTWGGGYWTSSSTINYPGGHLGSSDYKAPAWYQLPFTEMLVTKTDGAPTGTSLIHSNGGPNQTIAAVYSNFLIAKTNYVNCGYGMTTVTAIGGDWNRIGLAGCSDGINENTLFQLNSTNAGGYYHNRNTCMDQNAWGSFGNCSSSDSSFGGARIYIR